MKLKVKQIIIMIKEAHKGGPAKFYQNKTTKKMPIAHIGGERVIFDVCNTTHALSTGNLKTTCA